MGLPIGMTQVPVFGTVVTGVAAAAMALVLDGDALMDLISIGDLPGPEPAPLLQPPLTRRPLRPSGLVWASRGSDHRKHGLSNLQGAVTPLESTAQ